MLLLVEKVIIGGICYAIHRYARANNKYMKDYGKKQIIFISSILGCEQFIWLDNVTKLPVNNFEQIKYTSQFNRDFIKTIMKKVMKTIFFERDVPYLEKLQELHNDL